MIRYTTPTMTFRVVGEDITGFDVVVTLSQRFGCASAPTTLDIEAADLTLALDGSDTLVTFDLTQAQTGGFRDGTVEVQVNYGSGSLRGATEIKELAVVRNLHTGVLAFDASTDPNVPEDPIDLTPDAPIAYVTVPDGAVTMTKLADAVKLGYVRAFDTVVDMQAATDLESGNICHTNGFHSAGDGGAAYYTVSSSGTADGVNVIACANDLYAHYVSISITNATIDEITNDESPSSEGYLDETGLSHFWNNIEPKILMEPKGFVGVSATLQSIENDRRAHLFYTDDFTSLHEIGYVTEETGVDSAKIVKLGDFYYIWFGRVYYVSSDFINWTRGQLQYINPYNTSADAISSYRVWATQPMEYEGNYYITAAVGYNDNTFTNACNNTAYYFRPAYAPLTQDTTTGIVSVGTFTVISGFESSTSSWIDPWIIYSEVLGSYVMVVKNEDECKLHLYSGASIDNLAEISITDYLFGVEGGQLIESGNNLYLVATAYDLNSYNSSLNNYAGGIPYLTMIAKLTDRQHSLVSAVKWNLIKVPYDLRHIGVMECDQNIRKYVRENGYEADNGHYYHGEYDVWRVVINSTYRDAVDIVNAPGLSFGLNGDGLNNDSSAISLNYCPAFSGVITPVYSDSNNSHVSFKLGSRVAGTGKIIKTDPYMGIGFFSDYFSNIAKYYSIIESTHDIGSTITYQSLFVGCSIGSSGATIRTTLPISKPINSDVSNMNVTVSTATLICNGTYLDIKSLISAVSATKHSDYIEVAISLSSTSSTASLNNHAGMLNLTCSVGLS